MRFSRDDEPFEHSYVIEKDLAIQRPTKPLIPTSFEEKEAPATGALGVISPEELYVETNLPKNGKESSICAEKSPKKVKNAKDCRKKDKKTNKKVPSELHKAAVASLQAQPY